MLIILTFKNFKNQQEILKVYVKKIRKKIKVQKLIDIVLFKQQYWNQKRKNIFIVEGKYLECSSSNSFIPKKGWLSFSDAPRKSLAEHCVNLQ